MNICGSCRGRELEHTHGHYNAKEAADNPVYHAVKFLIFCLCTIQGPICMFLLHPQTK